MTILIILAALVLLFSILFCRYRLATGEPLVQTATVRFQLIDVGQQEEAFYRSAVELLCGQRRIFLANGELPFIYVAKAQFEKCWSKPPFQLSEEGRTVQITFTVRKLRFAPGYAPAEISSMTEIAGQPRITK